MAYPTPVNGQITDAVTQTNVRCSARRQHSPWRWSTRPWRSDSLAMENAQQAQGGLQQIGNAVTSSAITMILNAAQKT